MPVLTASADAADTDDGFGEQTTTEVDDG